MIVQGIVAVQALWRGIMQLTPVSFSIPVSQVPLEEADITVTAPPYENKLLISQQYVEAIIVPRAQARVSQAYVEVIRSA